MPTKQTLTAVAIAAVSLALAPAALAGGGGVVPPNAAKFADVFVTSVTQYAKANGKTVKVMRTDCVSPKPGRYMCSYAVRASSGLATCHVMQARWTPAGSSLFTVTLAGRTHSCANLSDALNSLG